MVDLDADNATTTNLTANLDDWSVASHSLETENADGETVIYFPDATTNQGYFKTIPEFRRAIRALTTYTVGLGYTTESSRDEIILENIIGRGDDTFQSIISSMQDLKKVVGDSFAEIIRNDNGEIFNLKPIGAERMRVIMKDGDIVRYEVIDAKGNIHPFKPEEILHFCNERTADEVRGAPVLDSVKWVIDALNEVMTDHRKVMHRNVVPLRILTFKSNDITKRDKLIKEYENAIKNGEILVLPEDVLVTSDNSITIQNPMEWIRYLENFFWIAVGTPRVIATTEGAIEASSKVGFLTYQPVYTSEQTENEADIWNQMAIRVKWKKPPSLEKNAQKDEAANTGQIGFQPNDTTAGVGE